MTTTAVIVCAVLAGLALFQTPFGLLFARLFYRKPTVQPPAENESLPPAVILLPLRGADPDLLDGLLRMAEQDYPARYEIQIVIDNDKDPAWDVVRRAMMEIDDESRIRATSLQTRSDRCSPQCSALVQAVNNANDSCEVVVIVDGDVKPHATWLRELVRPLLDEKVGVAHGNRWFMPPDATWGGLVRYLWNAAAVVPMWVFQIPWAGSFAIRKSVLMDSGLFDKWPCSVVPDAPSKNLLAKMGLSIRFVPSLMIVNREHCDLAFAHDFLKRQMTWTRTYHPHWFPIVLHALATTLVFVTAIVLAAIGCWTRQWEMTAWAGGGFFGYLLVMIVLLKTIERGVGRSLAVRGEELGRLTPAASCKLLFALPLTQVVYLVAVLLATFKKKVAWRGVTYYIRSPWNVEILGDKPFEQAVDSNASIG